MCTVLPPSMKGRPHAAQTNHSQAGAAAGALPSPALTKDGGPGSYPRTAEPPEWSKL